MSTISAESFLKELCDDYGLDDAPTDATSICDLDLEQADLLDIEFRVRQITGGTSQQLVRKLTKGMSTESLRKMIDGGQLSPQHFSHASHERIMNDDPMHAYKSAAEDYGIDSNDEDAVAGFLRDELPKMGREVAQSVFETIQQEVSGLPLQKSGAAPMTIGRLREILREVENEEG